MSYIGSVVVGGLIGLALVFWALGTLTDTKEAPQPAPIQQSTHEIIHPNDNMGCVVVERNTTAIHCYWKDGEV